ncbi:MAG TPA: alkaline phosphatase family protein, partial [Chitinophagaceae bacterium]|nr:alkaline phosphatase family protein [Chitinophagaceae bacterium]
MKLKILQLILLVLLVQTGKIQAQTAFNKGIHKINHVVVIYMENHGFDNLYGEFPGADGLSNATKENLTQLDKNGQPYTTLPQLNGGYVPANLPNGYFNIDQYIHSDKETPDVTHEYYREQLQINGGKMNKFAAYNSSAGLAMGYYKTAMLPLYSIAKQYTLCDRFFHSAFGGSFLNHQWLIAAATPVNPHAPAAVTAKLDSTGKLIKGGAVT